MANALRRRGGAAVGLIDGQGRGRRYCFWRSGIIARGKKRATWLQFVVYCSEREEGRSLVTEELVIVGIKVL